MVAFSGPALALALSLSGVQSGELGYRDVKPYVEERERKAVPDIWALHFKFRAPRYIVVETPDKGRQLVWYMTYSVTNRTGKPQYFVPQFTLVTDRGKVFHDVILPRAEAAVMAREDPTRPLLNSVTISSRPIPPTPKDSVPIERHGVVFWEGVEAEEGEAPPDAPNVKSFSIFVSGLSNAYFKVEDPKTKKPILRKKVLRLDFIKPGDLANKNEKEIKFVEPEKWDYR